ncbi:hypothetical protein CARUB_v10006492mg [Capsella rubella]|uniref:HMA domain-containing protein n=1 Tax=Capsella rubella TaxID=81985 RepID=R0F8U3_9BRAS|nr:hypothetical protein CARUB_v10006492mg [Capsella rubella]
MTTTSVSDVAFSIPDSCPECEKSMTDAITKFKGVNTSSVTSTGKIVVTGSFNQDKLLKKLIKVTGKDVEIVEKDEEVEKKSDETVAEKTEEPEKVIEPNSDERKQMDKFMMFSDENPNAKCTIS